MPDSGRSSLDGNISLGDFCSQLFSTRHRIWHTSRVLRGDRLDWLRIPQDVPTDECDGSEHLARSAVGLWHLPVIDFLGTATPHARYLIAYFLAFTGAMTAMRVLIAWAYTNTKSVPLAQLMHASSTGRYRSLS